jgi:pimeloyl-ACP methyl ester carboxylesterase
VRVLRTPDERFADLAGYPFAPHYVDVPASDDDPAGEPTIRLHHVDEGPTGAAETVVLLHGEPSWSYLYRTMVPPLVAAGHRVVAPDLVGFGRSDKPAARTDYTYARHVEWLRTALFDRLDLSGITLFGQDWGGLVGLRLVAGHPGRFRRVVVANTGLPTGEEPVTDAFTQWQRFSQDAPTLPVGAIVNAGRSLTCRRTSSPPTTRRSRTRRTKRGPASSRCSSRPRRTTPVASTTVGPGTPWRPSTARSCARSATATPLPGVPTASSASSCRVRPVGTT